MKTGQRIFLGAIGGLTPYLVTLLSIDFKSVIGGYEFLDWVGLVIRCLVLIFLGALVAYLHKTETEQFKVFQLGLAAPALLATIINGNPGNTAASFAPLSNQATYSFSILTSAYAQEAKVFKNYGSLKEPKVSPTSRFLRGLVSSKVKTDKSHSYFVIVGSHRNLESAENQVESLASKDYEAKVYSKYFDPVYFAVVIASNVTKEEAEKIRRKAINDGLPRDSYIWQYY